MHDHRLLIDFDKARVLETALDQGEAPVEQVDQVVVGDVARGDEQQALRDVLNQERAHEIVVIGDHDAILAVGNGAHVGISESNGPGSNPFRLPRDGSVACD